MILNMKKIIYGVFALAISIFTINMDASAENLNAKNVTQFKQIVYANMLKRRENIVINYTGNDYKNIFKSFEDEEFINEIGKIDDPSTSDDFDYMVQNISYVKTGMRYSSRNKATFTIIIKWRESYNQLQYVNARVKNILNNMQIKPNDSVYRTVREIHDFIVQNVEYDTSLVKENAYSALKYGQSTCQGYSLLFYKILTEAGIPCRYITGTGISEKSTGPHGWNIVKIKDRWYNVDATWDDPIYLNPNNKAKNALSREYFLKGSSTFDKSHVRDNEFKSTEFLNKYNISKTDFVISNDMIMADLKNDSTKTVEPTLEPVVAEEDNESEGGFIGFLKTLMSKDVKNMPAYIKDAFNELEPKQKLIIIGFCGFILIGIVLDIVLKIIHSFTHKNDNGMEE